MKPNICPDQRTAALTSMPADVNALRETLSALTGSVERMRRNLATMDAKIDRVVDTVAATYRPAAGPAYDELAALEAAPNVIPIEDIQAIRLLRERLHRAMCRD